jgi:GTPase involved in cell partitioning and DNA repair
MLDITHKDPLEQYRILENELFEYKENIFKDRNRIVVFNKKDCIANSEQKYKIFAEKVSAKSFLISAKEGDGVGEVLVELRRLNE